jgi:hypothetical protein
MENLVKTNNEFFITETALHVSIPVERIVSALRANRTTGQLVIALSDGGIRTIFLTERTKTKDSDRQKIHELLRSS